MTAVRLTERKEGKKNTDDGKNEAVEKDKQRRRPN